MTTERRDDDLQRWFDAAREAQRRDAPSFESTWSAAQSRQPRPAGLPRRRRGLLLLAAAAAVFAAAALWWPRDEATSVDEPNQRAAAHDLDATFAATLAAIDSADLGWRTSTDVLMRRDSSSLLARADAERLFAPWDESPR